MTDIDPKLVDVQLEPWKPGDPGGGWIEDPTNDANFGSAFPDAMLVPRNEWLDRIRQREEQGISLKHYCSYVYNQHPESSCVYNAAARCMMIRRNIQLGLGYQVILSPMSGYCRAAVRRHSGSTMWGALENLREYGLLPSNGHGQAVTFAHTCHENTPFIWPRSLPDSWELTARHFRCTEWLRIDNREQMASAVLNSMPVCMGRRGHSICYEDLVHDGRRFLIRYCDSYGTGRGEDGRLYDGESYWATGGAWACRVVTMPDDPARPAGPDMVA